MSTAEKQRDEARLAANRLRTTRATQRDEIREAGTWAEAIVDPPEELASYRLSQLFPRNSRTRGIAPQMAERRLRRALNRMGMWAPSPETKLRDLTDRQRCLLVSALRGEL